MKITWIEKDALACGGVPVSVENLASLKMQGIAAVLTLTEHPLHRIIGSLSLETLAAMGFDAYHIPVIDQQPPTRAQVDEAFLFVTRMKKQRKAVYLHCHAGIGRTGTMLHALYMRAGITLEEATARIKAVRAISQFTMLSEPQREFLRAMARDMRR